MYHRSPDGLAKRRGMNPRQLRQCGANIGIEFAQKFHTRKHVGGLGETLTGKRMGNH